MGLADVHLKHVWALGLVALAALGVIAPAALVSMLLVVAKVYVGMLAGWFGSKAFFALTSGPGSVHDEYLRAIIIAACIIGMATGV
jgi:hypothetical protein